METKINTPHIARKILFLAVCLFLLVSTARIVAKIFQIQKRIEKEAREVEELEKKNMLLKEDLKKVSSSFYVERKIREDLGLVKEGEIKVVLPEKEVLERIFPSKKSSEPVNNIFLIDNFKAWLSLFL